MIERTFLALALGTGIAVGNITLALGAEPLQPEPPGPWQLMPVTTMPAPAAWVFDTRTGAAFFCMLAANDKKAGVGCLAASFPKQELKGP
jgi:hypothetical protein